MKTKKIMLANLLLMMVLGLALGMPSMALAGKDHHRYEQSMHYDRHDHAYSQHRYLKKHRRNKHKYTHKHSHRHNNARYNHNYGQPRYNNSPIVYPVPTYGYPANLVLGIDTGNASFMLRY